MKLSELAREIKGARLTGGDAEIKALCTDRENCFSAFAERIPIPTDTRRRRCGGEPKRS